MNAPPLQLVHVTTALRKPAVLIEWLGARCIDSSFAGLECARLSF
jgi:hypothetical protein